MRDVRILDCTLRDGGYYTNWVFTDDLFKRYIEAMGESSVNYIELGFRGKSGAGSFANVTMDVFEGVVCGTPWGVMIDAKDALADPRFIVTHFSDRGPQFVRIAAMPNEITSCQRICAQLRDLGYQVMLNVMQCDDIDELIPSIVTQASNWNCLTALYFADSLGCMTPEDVEWLFKAVCRYASPVLGLGFHAHDNRGHALYNVDAAIASGATWVDGTVRGMGRGAGNAGIEGVLLLADSYSDAIEQLTEFDDLQKQYGWGPNSSYDRAAVRAVHPSYVQGALKQGIPEDRVLRLVNRLADIGSRRFTPESLARVIEETA